MKANATQKKEIQQKKQDAPLSVQQKVVENDQPYRLCRFFSIFI